jgi:DNA repair photolyase
MPTGQPQKGRGALSNRTGRFEALAVEAVDDGWGIAEEPLPPLQTTVQPEPAHSVITKNNSPDIPFDQSINPYRGCESGCVYCYARPSHQYLNLSAGLDFETRLFYKKDAAAHLREELNKRYYKCSPINLGANTDPYQPIERKLGVTRSILEVLAESHHPVTIVTKHALIVRDIDLLSKLAAEQLVKVFVSVTTLDDELKRRMEPRAAAPRARLAAIAKLAAAGIPTGVMFAPVVPAINDHELEAVLEASAAAGAKTAGYVLLRLPAEVKDLFYEWLEAHYPDRSQRVRGRIRELRGGRDNDSRFGHRMRGQGPWAELLKRRFEASCRRNGLGGGRAEPLTTERFRPPNRSPDQMELW